jgi:hypothetical protein
MNVTICTLKQKIQSSLLQYDDKSFRLLKWKSNSKDLTFQRGCEEFKSSHIQYWLLRLPWLYRALIVNLGCLGKKV